MPTRPAIYLPHGGGPCFFMDWHPPDTWNVMAAWLRQLGALIGKRPKAIVVVSAHWEEAEFTVTSHPHPSLIYDYYGFPPHTYDITYPAAGSPPLAARITGLLQNAGMVAHEDSERGFDHGVFIPLKLIYPDADIPIVQLSLKQGLDPESHIAAGRALAALRDEDILMIGSGMSYHNLPQFFGGGGEIASQQFDKWLGDTLATSPEARSQKLCQWEQAPAARQAHPREEHLLPLMVVEGAAGNDIGQKIFTDIVMGTTISAWQFG